MVHKAPILGVSVIFTGWGDKAHAQPLTWKARGSPLLDLFPATNPAWLNLPADVPAGIALSIIKTLKLHHGKVYLYHILNGELNKISDWFAAKANKCSLNVIKTKFILFSLIFESLLARK